MFVYPQSDLDRGQLLLSLLGTFWSHLYDGRDFVQRLLEARAEVEQQNWLNLMEAVRAFSRYEVPIFHTQNWHLHVIKASETGTWAIPANLVSVPLILNRLADPSVVLTAGVDYTIAFNRLTFRTDPFASGRFGTRPVFVDGVQTDTELFLWLFRGDFDLRSVYNHWGYILGLALSSSESYRDLLNAIFDAMVGGTALQQVQIAYSAMTGLPLAKSVETVESVGRDRLGQVVVTDTNVYRVPAGAVLAVAPGSTLTPGQSLTEDLQFAELNRGEVPDWVPALVLGRGMLVGQFHSDLVFDNRDLAVTVATDDDGYTQIEFPIGGFPLDVAQFWETIHAQGRARGYTLAELLDTRTSGVDSQPSEANLPKTINPVKFLSENVLRHNCLLVRVRMSGIAAGAIGLGPARLLRKIVPPHTVLLVLIEVSPRTTSVILNDDPTSETPGGEHAIASFRGAERTNGTIGIDLVRPPHVAAWKVSGTCR